SVAGRGDQGSKPRGRVRRGTRSAVVMIAPALRKPGRHTELPRLVGEHVRERIANAAAEADPGGTAALAPPPLERAGADPPAIREVRRRQVHRRLRYEVRLVGHRGVAKVQFRTSTIRPTFAHSDPS